MLRNFIKDIKKQIKDKCSDIKHVGVWNNQLQQIQNQEHVQYSFPACFIEIQIDDIEQLGEGYQLYNGNVLIHIIDEHYDTNFYEDDYDESYENNDIYKIESQVYNALECFEPNKSNSLQRINLEFDFESTNLYHAIQTYSFNYVDDSKVVQLQDYTLINLNIQKIN